MTRLATRLGRSAKLGRAAASLAWAGVRGRAADRQSLIDQLGSLHGLPQKIGQILSLGELESDEPRYTALTERGSPLPARVVRRELARRLGRPLDECFRSLDPDGRAASLGQVHRAVLHDGRAVAVKLQYPGMADALGLDVRTLQWLTTPFGGMRRGFDLDAWRREIAGMLRDELDYRREAEMLRTFGRHLREWPDVTVAEVIEGLSGDAVLTMTWVEGEPFQATREWPADDRRAVAETLLRLFLWSCLEWRLVHADPHPGNYRFRRTPDGPVVGVLDFGCVKPLAPSFAAALGSLIREVADEALPDDGDAVLARFVALGFNEDLLAPLRDRLPELTRVLFDPFRSRGSVDLECWGLTRRLAEVLGEHRANFRTAGPPAMIFLIRAYQGLIRYLQALDAPIPWRPVLDGLPSARRTDAGSRNDAMERGGPMRSRSLRLNVSEHGQTKVALTFKAEAAGWLPELIPEELGLRLAQRSIDVAALARDAVAREFAPGELFNLQDADKSVRVWLE
jgi:predicted unusual protein kinase regulating ubiquinone biosynthesis (AarF/ABC1/UbiB family)